MNLSELQEYITTKKGEQNLLLEQLKGKKDDLERNKKAYENNIKARWLLSEAQIKTQSQFKFVVENLVTTAIQAVYPRPFEFILEFERVRNKLECTPKLREGDIIYEDIRDAQGGGLCDIIAFAFRIVLWHLGNPRSINTILLDEPFRFLGSYTGKAGQMLKEISHKLGVQIIMITHDEELAEISDKSFKVSHDGTQSFVKEVVREKKIIEPEIVPVLRRKKK